MTKFLLSCFVKDGDRAKIGKLSGIVGIICNLLLAAAKLATGILSGSVAITADALNNLSDATSSIVTYLGFHLAARPADEKHPYGHARYEYISALVVAGVILIIGFELAKSSFDKILHPAATTFSAVMVCILMGSVAVKLWMYFFNRKLSKLTDSTALMATAVDCRNDCVATGAVLIAAVVEYFTQWRLDGYIGMAVSVFILYSGIRLAMETVSPLLGESASPELQTLIVDYVRSHPKVLGIHDLYVHDYGPGRRFASLHVEMDRREDTLLCHEIIDDMERECFHSHGVQLVIHYDPVITDDPELDRLHSQVQQSLTAFDSRLTLHDFRMVEGTGHTNLIFDVVLPADLRKKEQEIKTHVLNAIYTEGKTYYLVVTFDAEAFDPHK